MSDVASLTRWVEQQESAVSALEGRRTALGKELASVDEQLPKAINTLLDLRKRLAEAQASSS